MNPVTPQAINSMSQEQKLSGFIVKTQDLGEADLLLTFFTKHHGKVRMLAKSAKKMTSRLSSRLQPYSEVEVAMVGNGGLPKLISAEILNQYSGLLRSQHHIHSIMVMQELVLRSLADEQPNLVLYQLYHDTMKSLESVEEQAVEVVLAIFFTKALEAIGLSPRLLENPPASQNLFLSYQGGYFSVASSYSDDEGIGSEAYDLYQKLLAIENQQNFESFQNNSANELLGLLNKFASYQLERELRSVQYFLN